MAQKLGGFSDATEATCVRADRYGIDLKLKTLRGPGETRIGFAEPITQPDGLRAATVELAKRNSKQRIDPLIEESEVLRVRVKERRSRDSGNTVLSREFPGGVLILTGANSAVGLRSMPARYLFLDEVDGYPGDVEGEGDPILLAERRSATFQRRKILLVSTPKTKSLSRIQREYEASEQPRYFVPCPHCGLIQAHPQRSMLRRGLGRASCRVRSAMVAMTGSAGLMLQDKPLTVWDSGQENSGGFSCFGPNRQLSYVSVIPGQGSGVAVGLMPSPVTVFASPRRGYGDDSRDWSGVQGSA